MIQERLDALLRQLDPSRLEITNDSHLHGNPPEVGPTSKSSWSAIALAI